MATRILICKTCPRFAPNPGHEITAGAILGVEVRALAGAEADLVRIVSCLSGCKNPCNVTLDGDGKMRLRFSRLGPGDGPDILRAAALHDASDSGDIPADKLPPGLAGRLSAKSPPWITTSPDRKT